MSSPDTPVTEEETAAPEADAARDALVATLTEALGDNLVASEVKAGVDLWVRVTSQAWVETAQVLRNQCGMKYFNFLSVIDWLPSPFGRDMDAQVDQPDPVEPGEMTWGITGGQTRFQMLARLHDPVNHVGINIKADLDDDQPTIDSWITVYPGANWHEREAAEMFGVHFTGHPNLTKLYLPGAFEGNPMRKDFPLLARRVKPWPGLVDVEPLPGEDDDETEAS